MYLFWNRFFWSFIVSFYKKLHNILLLLLFFHKFMFVFSSFLNNFLFYLDITIRLVENRYIFLHLIKFGLKILLNGNGYLANFVLPLFLILLLLFVHSFQISKERLQNICKISLFSWTQQFLLHLLLLKLVFQNCWKTFLV